MWRSYHLVKFCEYRPTHPAGHCHSYSENYSEHVSTILNLRLLLLLASVPLVLVDDHTGHIVTGVVD
jgi:hypothetical protein